MNQNLPLPGSVGVYPGRISKSEASIVASERGCLSRRMQYDVIRVDFLTLPAISSVLRPGQPRPVRTEAPNSLPAGRAVPCAPRSCECVRIPPVFVISGGVQGAARPTFSEFFHLVHRSSIDAASRCSLRGGRMLPTLRTRTLR